MRGDATKVSNEFRPVLEGVNRTLDQVVQPLRVAADCVARISAGDIPEPIQEEFQGDFGALRDNLNGCLAKANKKFSTLWSEDFTDEFFVKGLRAWLNKGSVKHDTSHAVPYKKVKVPKAKPRIEVVFALDTTSSMSGLIDRIAPWHWPTAAGEPAPSAMAGAPRRWWPAWAPQHHVGSNRPAAPGPKQ